MSDEGGGWVIMRRSLAYSVVLWEEGVCVVGVIIEGTKAVRWEEAASGM